MTSQLPPHDLDIEAAVLSACLLDAAALDTCLEILEAQHFYSDANSFIFEACRALASEGSPVDAVSVASWLRAHGKMERVNVAYLGNIIDASPAIDNVAHHADVVRDKWRLRQAVAACHKYAARGYVAAETKEYLEELESAVFQLAHDGHSRSEPERLKEVLVGEFTRVSSGETLEGPGTGLTKLDEKLGGLQRGNLYIVAARPGMGKTALADMACRSVAARGEAVAFFSLEMPKGQAAARSLCSEAKVDLSRYRSSLLSEADWSALTTAANGLSKLPLWVDDQPAITLLDLRAKARRIASEAAKDGVQLGLIVVDYIGLMTAIGAHGTREQEVSSISRGLKALAKELDVPVLALSQLNRGVESRSDKRPLMSDLRESGALEQDADAIVFIYRDAYYNRDSKDGDTAELIIAKQRNGPTGIVKCRFIEWCTRFEDKEDDDTQ